MFKWTHEGYSNSKYFHTRLNLRKRRNEINDVKTENEWCEEPKIVKKKS